MGNMTTKAYNEWAAKRGFPPSGVPTVTVKRPTTIRGTIDGKPVEFKSKMERDFADWCRFNGIRCIYEPFKLKLTTPGDGDTTHGRRAAEKGYRPDFLAWKPKPRGEFEWLADPVLFEIKGFERKADVDRFEHAADLYSELWMFAMWTRDKDGWRELRRRNRR